jgi:preprotein translocase subunit SecA
VNSPAVEHRRTTIRPLRKLPRGLDRVVHDWAGRIARRPSLGEALFERAGRVHALSLSDLSERALAEELAAFQNRFRRGEPLPDAAFDRALAAVGEAARRQLGLAPHRVQFMAALASSRGLMLEMSTGEGKTLAISLAAVLAGWLGRPCHITTANDYLASRDADWLRPFYRACGLSVGCVTGEMEAPDRKTNYRCDLTYTTSKEVVADFLRDRLQLGPLAHATRRLIRSILQPGVAGRDGLVMNGLHTAIVDEADSALVDEAVTPLIISRKTENEPLARACAAAHELAQTLARGTDYLADERTHDLALTLAGLTRLLNGAHALPGMWRGRQRAEELVLQALRAREFFHRGKQYVVADGEIVIVDEYTGRLMPQRTWREGLHQAVEAKEGLTVTAPAETLARLSFQRFFRLYHRLSGLSGTIFEAAPELWHIYGTPIVRIPTHRPCQRIELPDRFFATVAKKWDAVEAEIVGRHRQRQPLLVGTRSIAASEMLVARLRESGLDCQLLNATLHREEADIISRAGEAGRITIATNMAGRGTDIRLGPGVTELGGLHVILTERHDSGRIDRQLIGRSARQGDPGSAQAFVSLEDELPVRHAPAWLRAQAARALAANLPAASSLTHQLVTRAQRHAERSSFAQRSRVLEIDTWIEQFLSFTGPNVVQG